MGDDLTYTNIQTVGYHGNKKREIRKFLRNEIFDTSISKKNWLGTGVYFFEEDLQQAIDWCVRVRNYSNWAIIEAEIKAMKVLDLILVSNYNTFVKILKYIRDNKPILNKLKKSYEKIYNVKVDDNFLNPLVLDLMYMYEPFDLVRHAFRVPGRITETGTNIEPMQIQLCVKNQKCIIDFWEVYNDGL